MNKPILFLNTLLVFLLGISCLFAQDAPVASPVAADSAAMPPGPGKDVIEAALQLTEAQAADLGPANKAFFDKFYQWRKLLKELRALKLEYQTARPERQIAIEKIYNEKIAEGLKTQPELLQLSIAALKETPYKNIYVINHLFGLIEWEAARENYEQAVAVFKEIEPYGFPEDSSVLYAVAALAAFKMMDFENANKWMEIVAPLDAPGDPMERKIVEVYLESIDDKNKSNTNMLMLFPMIMKNWEQEKKIREAEEAETDPEKMLPRVLVKTTKGDIVLELFENEAPNSVANFISLAEKGFYNNAPFHRVLPYFMAQGGDPTGTGAGGPGYTFDCECYQANARKHFRGSISMANAGPNTNGSQFFLTFVPTAFLDGKHTVFGRIVEGMEVLADLQRIDPESETQAEPDRIVSTQVLRTRSHEYKPVVNRGR